MNAKYYRPFRKSSACRLISHSTRKINFSFLPARILKVIFLIILVLQSVGLAAQTRRDTIYITKTEKTGGRKVTRTDTVPVIDIEQKKDVIYENETAPEFPGGWEKAKLYIQASAIYPPEAATKKIEGRVLIMFVIDTLGKIKDPVIIKSADYFLDQEAIRVIRNMPSWIPGTRNGRKATYAVVVPVSFSLSKPPVKYIF